MDIYYELNEITFIWNEEKARENISRHGISFKHAAEAFFDPFLIFVDASRNFEQRDGIIGETIKSQLLFVVHIQVEDEFIRIISARKATAHEKRQYYENQRP
jgi:uncharacterized DUF497 family protein